MGKLSRRAFVMCSLFGTQALLAGCGGGSASAVEPGQAQAQAAGSSPAPVPSANPAPAPTPAAPPPEWTLSQSLSLSIGAAATVDLRATLPAGAKSGGRFEVDSSGAALPSGVQLSAAGLLTVAANATVLAVSGVVFAYIEP